MMWDRGKQSVRLVIQILLLFKHRHLAEGYFTLKLEKSGIDQKIPDYLHS